MATTAVYYVSGMTCNHCVAAVAEEISKLDGVQAVNVDLIAGGDSQVIVTITAPLDDETVRAAVDEAGYQVIRAG